MPRIKARITVRIAMVGVAIAALTVAGLKFAGELRYQTSKGWNTSVLPVGGRVVPVHDLRFDSQLLPAGTPCVVVSDPPDEDSAYPDRSVTVRIVAGQHRGTIVDVERILLRVR